MESEDGNDDGIVKCKMQIIKNKYRRDMLDYFNLTYVG